MDRCLSATLEVGGLTVDASVFPRYLYAEENVTREIDTLQANGTVKKTIVLRTVSRWQTYGECSITYAFDPAGHYAFTAVYKVGRQPPNFDRVDVVQSGVVVRF